MSFPLVEDKVEFSQADLAKSFVPENDMETEIQAVLQQSGLATEEEDKDDLGKFDFH